MEKYILRSREKHDDERLLNDELKKIDVLIKKKEREQRNLKKMMMLAKEGENLNTDKLQEEIDLVENN